MVKKGTPPAAARALSDIRKRAKTLSRHINRTWDSAHHAPMFCRIRTKETTDPKTGNVQKQQVRHTTRLINGSAYLIAAAGATANVTRSQQMMCANLGVEFEKSVDGVPLTSATLTAGTKYLLEQFLCAYVQECIQVAQRTKSTLGKSGTSSRLTAAGMRLAFEHVDSRIFRAAGIAPRKALVLPLKKSGKGQGGGKSSSAKKTDDDEYQGETAAEEAAQDAAAERAVAESTSD